MDADLVRVGDASVVLVAVVFEVDSPLRRVRAEQIGIAILVAGGDQPFQRQLLEVVRKVVKEIADLGIVAVAQDGLALEMRRVMPQLLLDVRKLSVKLVLLRRLRSVHASIQRVTFYGSNHLPYIPSSRTIGKQRIDHLSALPARRFTIRHISDPRF